MRKDIPATQKEISISSIIEETPMELPKIGTFTITRTLPENFNENERALYANELHTTFTPKKWEQYRNAIVTPSGYIHIQHSPTIWWKKLYHPQPKYFLLYFAKIRDLLKGLLELSFSAKTKRMKKAYYVCDNWSQGFFHWFCEMLPALHHLDTQDKNAIVLLPEYVAKKGFVKRTCALFKNIKFIVIKKHQRIKVQTLTHMFPLALSGRYHPPSMKKLSKLLRDNFPEDQHTGERIYISRTRSPRRKIENEKELLPTLKKFGFDYVAMEGKSLEQQLAIIKKAKILLSNHGAGLTHMLIMKKGSTIIEIRGESGFSNTCYYRLAKDIGHKYYYLIGGKRKQHRNADVHVDPKKLEALLKSITKEK